MSALICPYQRIHESSIVPTVLAKSNLESIRYSSSSTYRSRCGRYKASLSAVSFDKIFSTCRFSFIEIWHGTTINEMSIRRVLFKYLKVCLSNLEPIYTRKVRFAFSISSIASKMLKSREIISSHLKINDLFFTLRNNALLSGGRSPSSLQRRLVDGKENH